MNTFFRTRGVVLVPSDLSLADWLERAKKAGLTTIGLHHGVSPKIVEDFIRGETGQKFLESCRKLGMEVEYELHAIRELLPRDLFEKDKTLFRMNNKGERAADSNLCVHSERALEIVAENAVAISKVLRPTTSRYFLWGDDAQPWCRCKECKEFSDTDQSLLLENWLLKTLHQHDACATVAHLAYANTLAPPKQIKPDAGIFLEFAPIEMRHRRQQTTYSDAVNRAECNALEANLKVFPAETAQALEYWLDASMYSNWKRPSLKIPFDSDKIASDLKFYRDHGIRHITSFAVYVDADYLKLHGEPPLAEYGKLLLE